MARIHKPELAIQGVYLSSGRLYDDLSVIPGCHLRWSFRSDMGFPKNGFTIQRLSNLGQNKGPLTHMVRRSSPKVLWSTKINLPNNRMDALQRLRMGGPGMTLNSKFSSSAQELVEVIERLKAPPVSQHMYDRFLKTSQNSGLKSGLRIIDLLLLAGVDPYVARMLGIYVIDEGASSTEINYYRIIGHWGNSSYSQVEIVFDSLSTSQTYQSLQFGALNVISTGRTIGVPSSDGNDIYPKHLFVFGDANPAIKFYFDYDVEELILEFELMSRSGSWDVRLDGEPGLGVVETGGNKLRISRPGNPFQRIEFVVVPGIFWRIFKIIYCRKATEIGDVQAFTVVDPKRTQPVSVPLISQLKNESVPAILDTTGKVQNKVSQVAVSAIVPLPRPEVMDLPDGASLVSVLPILTTPYFPVRTMFGRSKDGETRIVDLNQQEGIFSPSLYRESSANPLLPSLYGIWSFDGIFENMKDGLMPRLLGNPKFVKDTDGTGIAQFSLQLSGNESLELLHQNHLKDLGDSFTLEASLKVSKRNGSFSTIIGNSYTAGFWFGLAKLSDGNYKPRLWIKGRKFDASESIPPDFWVRVSVMYNGASVIFQYSSTTFSNAEPPQAAALGKIDIPPRNVMIGAESGSTSESLQMPYIGKIMDVAIWRKPIHPSESAHLRSKWKPFLGQHQDICELIFRDKTCYGVNTAREQIKIEKTADLKALSSEFSIYLWVLASKSNAVYTTLVGNNFNECFWIGLRKIGANYLLRVWINNVPFEARSTFPAEQWAHLGLAYNGSQLKLFVNGKLSITHSAELGPLKEYDFPIAIGSDINSPNPANQYRFNGMIQDIQFWRSEITAFRWYEKSGAVQFLDRYLKNDKYRYFVKGVDLFGRASEWSPSRDIITHADPVYGAPLNLHAKFEPLKGTLISVAERTDVHGVKIGYLIRTNIPYNAVQAEGMISYDLTVSRDLVFEVPSNSEAEGYRLGDTERITQKGEQRFEISQVGEWRRNPSETFLELEVISAPFEQLIPEEEDLISIPFDCNYELKWSWSGSQQLYYEEVREFRLYQLQGHLNEISGLINLLETVEENLFRIRFLKTIPLQANELVDQKCLIGPHMFSILTHGVGSNPEFTVRYNSFPRIIPSDRDVLRITIPEGGSIFRDYHKRENWRFTGIKIPLESSLPWESGVPQSVQVMEMEAVSEELMASESSGFAVQERKTLLEQGVDWIPLSRIYKLVFPIFARPADHKDAGASNYVPGALVFFDEHPDRQRWRSFYVLWHRWNSDYQLQVYVTPGEKDEDLPQIRVAPETSARLYFGKQFFYQGNLPLLPEFTDSPTIPFQLALSASDGLIESEISRWATMVAVNRKRPPQAPKPDADFLGKADYHGKCKVRVSWGAVAAEPGALFKIYRSNDSAIYTRDLEQRRTRQGYYKGMQPEEVFGDDVDISDWLSTKSAVGISELFAEKDSQVWKDHTRIWRAWADRFYPSLSDRELEGIAGRAGNEKAFSLVQAKPLRELSYIDEVNGTIKNRYYYRLRLQNEALAESTIWGPISEPVIPPVVTAPAQPVFTKIEAGDRQITLHWALNREPDFKEYVLYRADTQAELEDLRWWSLEPDPRVVARISDPRIKVSGRGCSLPGELPVSEVLGVYLPNELDEEASPLTHQPRAMNYWNPGSSDPSVATSTFTPSPAPEAPHRIENLRRIADGKAVVVLYRGESDEILLLKQAHEQIPFVNTGLEGLKEYFYRLVALSEGNQKSQASKPIRSKTLERTPPPFPTLIQNVSQVDSTTVEVTLTLSEPVFGMEISILTRTEGSRFWKKQVGWESLDRWGGFRGEFSSTELIEFRVMARSAVGKRVSADDFTFFSNELTS